MAYHPRAETGIPTEPVGSLPRPDKLQAAYADYDAGKISREQLETEQDAAAKDSVSRGEATGAPIISDGEQWWSSFATYPVTTSPRGDSLCERIPATRGRGAACFPTSSS